MITFPRMVPGLLLCGAVTLAASWMQELPFFPFTVEARHPIDRLSLAIVIGIVVRAFLPRIALYKAGIAVAAKRCLPWAIGLLGIRLNFHDLLAVSRQALVLSVVCVVISLVGTVLLCRWRRVPHMLGLLIGIGTAICGSTAIAIVAPVVQAKEEDTAFAISTVTLFGLIAIFVLPPIGWALGMSQFDFGVWAGVAVHATAQVIATAAAYGAEATDIAVVVKLGRILLLVPLLMILPLYLNYTAGAHVQSSRWREVSLTSIFPPFVLGFVCMALLNTMQWVPATGLLSRGTLLSTASFLLTLAMAGIGLSVDLKSFRKIGVTPLYVGLVAAIVLAAMSYALQQWLVTTPV